MVCLVKDIVDNHYVLIPVNDGSLKINVLVDNDYLRKPISKIEALELIEKVPSISVIEVGDKIIENEYKALLKNGAHEDLIKIIKTTYLRNKKRLDENKKIGDKYQNYFNQAEKFLYTELAVALELSYEDTKKFVINSVEKIYK